MTNRDTDLPFRFARAQGETIHEMRVSMHQTGLYKHGDAVLIWVNEGDLLELQLKASIEKPSQDATENIIPLGGVTKLNLPTDRVLDEAKGRCSKGVIILGYDDDGEFYFASSIADGGSVIWLMEMAKKRLLEVEVE